MSDWFLERSKAKLAIANLAGFLDRWIRGRLREASEGELWVVNRSIWKRCRELATLDSPGKIASMGALYRTYKSYPLVKYVEAEESLRFSERMAADPEHFRTPLDDLSNEEIDSYIAWKRNKNPDDVDKLDATEQFALWRREGRRALPVMPRPGSLPSNANVRRPPNNQEGRGRSGHSSQTAEAKEKAPSDGAPEGQSHFSKQDRDVH